MSENPAPARQDQSPRDSASDEALWRSLVTAIGSQRCSRDLADLVGYSRDVSPLLLHKASQGAVPALPRAIVWPDTPTQLAQIMQVANDNQINVTLYGGGSGIVGGAVGAAGIVCDMKGFDTIEPVDEISQTVKVGSGVIGRVLEDRLNDLGWSCGHEPQSNNSATVGGWIAHRGAGFASTRYGKIEDRLLAIEAVLPNGEMFSTRISNRAASGPEIKQLLLGGEGALGAVTGATLAVHPLPERCTWDAVEFASFAEGADFLRRLLQREVRPAIVRLYDERESRFLYQLIDRPRGKSLLILRFDGDRDLVAADMKVLHRMAAAESVTVLGPQIGDTWWPTRHNTPYLVNPIREGGIADSLDVAVRWSALPDLYNSMLNDMEGAVGEHGEVFGHIGHAYENSTDLYMIFRSSRTDAPAEVVYAEVLEAAFGAAERHGATLSHHHGIGSSRAPWMERFVSVQELSVIRAVKAYLDPSNVLNPGKLLPVPTTTSEGAR